MASISTDGVSIVQSYVTVSTDSVSIASISKVDVGAVA